MYILQWIELLFGVQRNSSAHFHSSIFCRHFINIHESDSRAPALFLPPSLARSTLGNASAPPVLQLHCAAGRRRGRRLGAIVMAILQYQYPDTATKRQQPMPHHSTPLTPSLSLSLSPSILTQSILPSLTKYVCIDPVPVPLLSLSLSLHPSISFFLSNIYQISSPPQTASHLSCFLLCLSFHLSLSFLRAISSPSPLHVFLSHSLSAY